MGSSAPYACTNPSHVHENISHKRFKINDRFESTGKSDYNFVWLATAAFNEPTYDWLINGSNHFIYTFDKIVKVDKNQIGTDIYSDFVLFSPYKYSNGLCFDIYMMNSVVEKHFLVGAAEHDFFRTFKIIGNYTLNGNTVFAKITRKYQSDWYYFDPSSNSSYPFINRHPTPYSYYNNYNKGHLQIQRWQ